jgi:hypothetical protein
MNGFPQLPSFHAKSQELEIHTEKNFKEFHKVEVLARICASITGKKGGRKHLLLQVQG